VDRENFKLYLTKLEETRISSEMDLKKIANVSVIMPAQMPLEPMDSNKRLFLAIGFFIAVFGSIGLAVFLEYFSEDLERPEEIEKLLGAPVLASVPWKKS
jgi:capsular polysaccharide biosynthesis protein